MLKKRSVMLSGHATSVALEPEFWVILDRIAGERGLSHAALLAWVDSTGSSAECASISTPERIWTLERCDTPRATTWRCLRRSSLGQEMRTGNGV